MKMRNLFIACLIALTLTPAFAEQTNKPAPKAETPALTRFNLDFPGGTPQQLVAAIEKATGKPLNAIIPDKDASVQLPALKMSNVDVAQLFQALEQASLRTESFISGTYYGGTPGGSPGQSYSTVRLSCGFKTSGTPTDISIWYFYADKLSGPPLMPSKACRFYSLAPYLDRGLTVDDITTAIQTGWKMLGDSASAPGISFHKETKLLIAVGEPGKLETIDAVLKALEPPKPKPAPGTVSKPKPAEKLGEPSKADE